MKRFLVHLIILCTVWMPLCAEPSANDSVQVSLLTCAPGSEVYALFGHTALRYRDLRTGEDWAFNYGMFSFQTPHFVYRFVKGETDYQLGVVAYRYFEMEYAYRGSYVEQQELNLTLEEKQQLLALLSENYLPENRTYRYNYFYDNCTTRARDMVEASLQGTVEYPREESDYSFRGIIHQYTEGHPWAEFGIDFLLGAEADKPIPARLQMFAPFYMLHFADSATIVTPSGERRPLVARKSRVVDPPAPEIEKEFPLSPLEMSCLLLGLVILVGAVEFRMKKVFWGFDFLLYAAQGLAGCIIAFLFFFSVHPTVASNYLLILFNPLPLLYLPVMIYREIKGKKEYYHRIAGGIILLFILAWPVMPQSFNVAILPLALSLLLRSVTHILFSYKKRTK